MRDQKLYESVGKYIQFYGFDGDKIEIKKSQSSYRI